MSNANNLIVPVILCGGSGTRLWPRSRPDHPKPFLPLIGYHSLFQQTLRRCSSPALFAPLIVVAGHAHVAAIRDQSAALDMAPALIVEPLARNTAAAIALAAARMPADALMLVCPSDQHIPDVDAFHSAVAAGVPLAQQDRLVTFGIVPTAPETGFGYIQRGDALGVGAFDIARFVEKPDAATARSYCDAGDYYWNSGMFLFRAGRLLEELERHAPEIAAAVRQSVAVGRDADDAFHPDGVALAAAPSISIDYAVMEKTDRAAVVAAPFGWSDIGNWQAVHAARSKDAQGNCLAGDGQLLDCRNVLVDSDGPRVSVLGMEDVIVVVDGNDILVTNRANAHRVGQLKQGG